MVRLIVLYLHQTEVCVHCMRWSSRERGGQGEGGLRCVHWLSERGRGICIGCRREGARWTEGGRVEVCALAVGEREGCVHWLWMEGAREWEMGMEGLRGGWRERGRERDGGSDVWGQGSEWENIEQHISME